MFAGNEQATESEIPWQDLLAFYVVGQRGPYAYAEAVTIGPRRWPDRGATLAAIYLGGILLR